MARPSIRRASTSVSWSSAVARSQFAALHGEAGNDLIEGGEGDDLAFADAGDDRLYGGAGNDGLGGGECPTADKDRQAAQQHPLQLRQQIVAPVERRPQRLLAQRGGPAATGQQSEALIQAPNDLVDRQDPRPGSRQFNRQRVSTDERAECDHIRQVGRHVEIPGNPFRVLREQRD